MRGLGVGYGPSTVAAVALNNSRTVNFRTGPVSIDTDAGIADNLSILGDQQWHHINDRTI
ncbi:hypothetical protein DWV00_04000 [Trinickia dinghuensis]|uniref:Uncharacterized protein n=1 Tax=Trinickia dinghuensis TaxID=2291023 RepID=A0A3D8K6R4_9BURK|nr:hypothetical protein DWV00_04000 [Trinickia dinghuensis]